MGYTLVLFFSLKIKAFGNNDMLHFIERRINFDYNKLVHPAIIIFLN